MINRLLSQTGKTLTALPRYAYINPPKHSETHHHVTLPISSPA
jgi:hypothetical protein